MIRWGVIIGFLVAIVFKLGWIGFLNGFIVGCFFRQFFKQFMQRPVSSDDKRLFLIITFEVLGHISKAKGVVTRRDIDYTVNVMDQMKLTGELRKEAQTAFTRGKENDYPLRLRLRELYQHYRYHKNMIRLFLEFQLKLAFDDGKLDEHERRLLFILAEELKISRQQFELYLRMLEGGANFQRNQQYSNTNRQRGSSTDSSHTALQDAYNVLGVNSSDDPTTIKRAYKRLMNEHHPDKLVSKGLPPEMLELTKQRTQEIQAAYDFIKQQRGFK